MFQTGAKETKAALQTFLATAKAKYEAVTAVYRQAMFDCHGNQTIKTFQS